MTRSAMRIIGVGILALAGLPAIGSAQSFTGTLDDVVRKSDFPLIEPPPGGPGWELLTIFITDSVWLDPGEIQLFDEHPVSDRIIFFNQEGADGRLHARIFFGSDDEQGQLPPDLPPIGTVPIIGSFPEQTPVTIPFHARRDDGTFADILATIFSDFDPNTQQVSDALRIVPTPGSAMLLAMGCFGALRRRR